MKPVRDYQKDLIKYLKDPKEAAGYLNASLEAGDLKAFLLALRNVAEAQGNMTRFAKKNRMSRVGIYKMTSKTGNPSLENVIKIIRGIGLQFKIEKGRHTKLAA